MTKLADYKAALGRTRNVRTVTTVVTIEEEELSPYNDEPPPVDVPEVEEDNETAPEDEEAPLPVNPEEGEDSRQLLLEPDVADPETPEQAEPEVTDTEPDSENLQEQFGSETDTPE